MAQIYWDTDCNAPCIGMIVQAGPPTRDDDTGRFIANSRNEGRTRLIQTDWDYPGVASTFGWSTRQVQAKGRKRRNKCRHDGTDGTVDCRECGVTASEFISAAGEFLTTVDGKIVDDPGYFNG